MAPSTKPAGGVPAATVPATSNKGLQSSSNGIITGSNAAPGGATVNRKKQKRRQKLAARQAATQSQQDSNNDLSLDDEQDYANGYLPAAPVQDHGVPAQPPHPSLHYANEAVVGAGNPNQYTFSDEDYDGQAPSQSSLGARRGQKKGNKKKKKKKIAETDNGYAMPASHSINSLSQALPPPPPPPPPSQDVLRTVQQRINKDPIWDTSSQEERSRIKDFWLSLGEEDRKSLVKIEKEAVLRKMKEQQKHSCSCTVCGRKRTAIEEELEVLYDAYYEELEQFANHNQQLSDNGTSNSVASYPHPLNRHYQHRQNSSMPLQKHLGRRLHEHVDEGDGAEDVEDDEVEDEEEDADEDYSEDDYEDDDYSGDETDEIPPGAATDFFTFGNSLTVKGGILTVADDLLKNGGQKFIDMMEQLAERRMQREEEAARYPPYTAHSSLAPQHDHNGYSHSPEDEEYDDEEDDEYDSQDEDYEDDDEVDTMTEEQRMEEGRRMFQIFAARMFEQRVLTAYREKTSREKADKLIQELADEQAATSQQNAKKAREAEKKKQKKQQQKQKQAEEKARKEAEKAAAEAALREAEEKKQEEARKRREEQKKKKEAERKAQEEEKLKKEAEKIKRQEAERERQQEAERKAREQKAEEKRRKEEAKRKEQEEREFKEKEAREKKAREEQERKERDEQAKAEREAREKKRREEQIAAAEAARTSAVAQSQADAAKRTVLPTMVALPPNAKQTISINSQISPQPKATTPAVPKTTTPTRSQDLPSAVATVLPPASSSQTSIPQQPQVMQQSSVSLQHQHHTPLTHQNHPHSHPSHHHHHPQHQPLQQFQQQQHQHIQQQQHQLQHQQQIQQQQQQRSKPQTPETSISSSKQSSPGRLPMPQTMPFPTMPISKTPNQQQQQQQQPLPPQGSHMHQPPHMHGMMPPTNIHQGGVPPGMAGMNSFHHLGQTQMLHGMPPRALPGQPLPIYHGQYNPPLTNHTRPYIHAPNPPPPPPPPPGINTANLQPQQSLRNAFAADQSATGPSPSLPSSASPASATQTFTNAGRENLGTHSRQPSNTLETGQLFDGILSTPSTQPIGKPPAPIKPPINVRHENIVEKTRSGSEEVDELSNHLGSSALLDDSDEPLPAGPAAPRRPSGPPGMPSAPSNPSLIGTPFDRITSPFGTTGRQAASDNWRTPAGFATPGISTANRWNAAQQTKGWGAPGTFPVPHQRQSGNMRPITVRLLACQACRILTAQNPGIEGFHDLKDVVRLVVDTAQQNQETPPSEDEVLNILDTEGDTHNGGGTFHTRRQSSGRPLVKWERDANEAGGNNRASGLGLGEIGSPSIGSVLPNLGGLGTRGF